MPTSFLPLPPPDRAPVPQGKFPKDSDQGAVVRDPAFYPDQVVFKVGNTLFKVPRRKFEDDSETFKDMFTLPGKADSNKAAEGTSDEHPLVLEGIETDEFRTLLRAMFRPHYGPNDTEKTDLNFTEWTSVLKLSTMWCFTRLRHTTIEMMTPLLKDEDPVQRVVLSRKYEVPQWLFPGLHALARRKTPLQLHEVTILGISTIIRMAEVRESVTVPGGPTRFVYREYHDFSTIIRRVFNDELNEDCTEVSY